MATAELQPPPGPSGPGPPSSPGPQQAADQVIPRFELVPTASGLAVRGEVDLTTWAALSEAVDQLVDSLAEGGDVVLDLHELSFIDGHSMQLLALAARRLGPSRRLVLRQAPRMLLRIAEILRLSQEPRLLIEGRGGDGPA